MTEAEVAEDMKIDGFLSPLLAEFRPEIVAQHPDWFDFAMRINRLAMVCWAVNPDKLSGSPLTSPASLIARLMARAIGAFDGAVILLERGMNIEADTLGRALHETALWMAYLAKSPVEAQEYFLRDELKAKEGRFKMFKQTYANDAKQLAIIETTLSSIKSDRVGRSDCLTIEKLARAADLGHFYTLYKRLCGSAAHASMLSTNKYITDDGDGELYHLLGPNIPASGQVFPSLCLAFLICLDSYTLALDDQPSRKTLQGLEQEFFLKAGHLPVAPLE